VTTFGIKSELRKPICLHLRELATQITSSTIFVNYMRTQMIQLAKLIQEVKAAKIEDRSQEASLLTTQNSIRIGSSLLKL